MSCQIVIVLGMHRSGTSAVAGYLHSLGLELPSETLSAHPKDNPEGYFEPQRMVQLNNRLLAALGLNWQSTRPISADELAAPDLAPIKEEIKQYLTETCQPGRKLVFKDPRLCRLLPVWLPLIKQHCQAPLIIHTVRNANAVADSLARRAEQQELAGAAITSRYKATLLWLRYNLDAWHHGRASGLAMHTLSYETFSTSKAARKTLQQWLKNKMALPRSKANTPRPARPQQTSAEWQPDQDWQLLLTHAEHCLANSHTTQASDWLGNLHRLAELRIPAKHQNDPVAPPPEDLVIAATIKHISGQQPKPLVPAGKEHSPKSRWEGSLARLRNSVTKTKQNPKRPQASEDRPEYLFISEHPTSRSHIYRVKNPVDALNRAGHRAAWLTPEQALQNPDAWKHCKKLIIHRCEWSDTLAELYQTADRFGVPKIYDIDDYIFEPALIDQGHIDFINRLPEQHKQEWKAKIARFRQALLAADRGMAPTNRLVEAMEQLGIPSSLKPNGLSPETIALSEHWHGALKNSAPTYSNQPAKRLIYASGTPTHEGDFGCFRNAVADFLNNEEDWGLTIIGALDTSNLKSLLNTSAQVRLEHRPLVEHINLPYELARGTLNLAPLQENNPFCAAKSPLKWFEAAAAHVPTLATQTGAYSENIKSKETGLLTTNTAATSLGISKLALNPTLLPQIASQARQDASQGLAEKTLIDRITWQLEE